MIKFKQLLESNDKWIDLYYRIKEQFESEWYSGQKHQSWRVVPKRLLEVTWKTFAKYGRVNERALDKIWEIVEENVIKIGINSDIRDGNEPEFFGKDEFDEITEKEWDRFFEFISDRSKPKYSRGSDMGIGGHARYSDGSRALGKLAAKVDKTNTPEEKLLAIDQILNFVHGIGPMAGWFVEGGVNSLEDLSTAEIQGIQLQGRLSETLKIDEPPNPLALRKNRRKQCIHESISGKSFIVVDVQPEYKDSITFIPELVRFINTEYENMSSLTFLYNGQETLGMVSEGDYVNWWWENGVDETILDQVNFYDKGYAYFRYCMDAGSMDEETIANFVRFMYENNINDSRDMDRDNWAEYLRQYRRTDKKDVYELLKHAQDCVHIPDLMEYLKRFNNIALCGGGVDECLKEVEIALLALKKPYSIEHRFTY